MFKGVTKTSLAKINELMDKRRREVIERILEGQKEEGMSC